MSIRPAAAAAGRGCDACAAVSAAAANRPDAAAAPADASAVRNVRLPTPCVFVIASPARPLAIVEEHPVQAVAERVGGVDGLFVGTRDRVNRVEPAGQASELAERAEYFAREIHLVHLADAADEDHLVRSGRDAQRPRQAIEIPFLLECAIGVEHLN